MPEHSNNQHRLTVSTTGSHLPPQSFPPPHRHSRERGNPYSPVTPPFGMPCYSRILSVTLAYSSSFPDPPLFLTSSSFPHKRESMPQAGHMPQKYRAMACVSGTPEHGFRVSLRSPGMTGWRLTWKRSRKNRPEYRKWTPGMTEKRPPGTGKGITHVNCAKPSTHWRE